MLSPDILHEWDLGGGKGVIVHLFRILDAVKRQDTRSSSALIEIDER
jgi:hypothetical protein